tara:strand:- start:10879 stop:11070 length:192 start_codon:yes stop_codon:yes gene_type:complete
MKAGDLIIDNSDDVVLLFIKWLAVKRWNGAIEKMAYLFDFKTQQIYDYTEEEVKNYLEVISYG